MIKDKPSERKICFIGADPFFEGGIGLYQKNLIKYLKDNYKDMSITAIYTTTPLTIYAAIARSASTPAPRRRLSPRERWMQAAAFPIGRSRTRRPSERHSGIVWPIACSAVISARMSAPGTAAPPPTMKKTLTPRPDCWK